MSEHVRIYEEKKSVSIWAWLLPLLLLLGLLAYFLTHRHVPVEAPVASQATPVGGQFPDLGTVHFDTDKATLTPDGQATLQRAAAAMKGNPNVHLRMEGYTDSTGTTTHNDTLADQRAKTVVNYLKDQGVDGSRLTGEGFGAAKPVDNNDTTQGKADNRRVELFSQQ